MEKSLKELLLKDLCARLPYGVRMNVIRSNVTEVAININPFNEEIWLNDAGAYVDIDEIKPYLRPMSSMTEKEKEEYYRFYDLLGNENFELYKQIDWLYAHHFDFRNLIPMGLVLPATEGMYNF